MNAQIAYWIARGPVRGDCDHQHRNEEAAEACAERDRHSVAQLGGGAYSDRRPAAIDQRGYQVGAPEGVSKR